MLSHRRLLRRTPLATGGIALILAAGGLALAPVAQAGTVTPTVHCSLPAGQGEATGPQNMTVDLTTTSAPPGGKVHAKITLGVSPAKSTTNLSNIPTTPAIDLALSGGATGTVTIQGPTVNLDYTSGQAVVLPPFEGDFFLPATASGVVNLTPLRTRTTTVVFGGTYQTPCDVTAGGGTVATVTAQGGGSTEATVSAPTGSVKPSTSVPLAGGGWTPGATATPTLCDAAGGNCDAAKIASSTLAIDASGGLSGSIALASSWTLADGSYAVQVSDGTKQARAPLQVKAYVPAGPYELTPSPDHGPVGSVITVSGKNYHQDQQLNVVALDAEGNTLDDTAVYPSTTTDGTFTTEFTISDPAIAFIHTDEGAVEGTETNVPFTVTTNPVTLAAGAATVKPGATVSLSGTGWPAGAAASAALCAADGSGCDPAKLSATNLGVNASGALSGTVTLASSAGEGAYRVQISSGGLHVTAPLTVAKTFITLSPSTGPTGTKVTVVGQGFAPVSTVQIDGLKADGSKTGDSYRTKVVGLDGSFSQTFTVNDPATVALQAREWLVNGKKALARFAVGGTPPPPAPSYALSPDSGPVGTVVQVTGRSFAPVATVAVTGRKADGSKTSDACVTRMIGLDGTFALNFTVKDPATASIMASEVLANGKVIQTRFTVR
ncbi:hypothetical protein OHA37_07390 [Streptomyces sp. NBC_00335]|uniref:hypothetical protein n=1 Tax=unclassified Streptomyces TaxID=2593676 RepID=UPI00224F50AB|nr:MULTISPECIES: hypothetical protein [unclassified Streptomyces]MCX5403706.1 hypothetical protein [Streptomyces sp. NBC_00086]